MLEIKEKEKDEVEIIDQQQIKTKHNHIGSLKPQAGHRCFEFNIDTCIVVEAEISHSEIVFNRTYTEASKKKSIYVKPDCFYLTALNKKNAIRKLRKIGYHVIE